MRPDIVPGAGFPDYEFSDHRAKLNACPHVHATRDSVDLNPMQER